MLSNVITSSLLSTGMLPIYSIARIIYIYLYFIYLSIYPVLYQHSLFIHPNIYLFIHLSIHFYIHQSIHSSSIHPSTPSIHSIQPSIHSSIIHTFIQPSIHSSINPSIHPYIHSSIIQCIHPLTLSLTYIRTIRKMIPLLLKQNNY